MRALYSFLRTIKPLNDDLTEEEISAEIESVKATRHAGKAV